MVMPSILFVVTFLAWDVSAANFNIGVTVAYMFADMKDFKKSFFRSVLLILAQLAGVVCALFVCFGVVKITEYGDNG